MTLVHHIIYFYLACAVTFAQPPNDEPVIPRGRRVDQLVPACERHLLNKAYLHDPVKNRPYDKKSLNGVVAIGAPMSWKTLRRAGGVGTFLMGHDQGGAFLVQPRQRAIMDVPGFRARVRPRDLTYLRKLKLQGFYTTHDRAGERVIQECARATRRDRINDRDIDAPNWIDAKVADEFVKMHFHPEQLVHSVEVWLGNDLVGGLFISFVNGVPTGESMFFRREVGSNIGKLALFALLERLEAEGHPWLDVQTMNPDISLPFAWGAYLKSRAEHERDLAEHQARDLEY